MYTLKDVLNSISQYTDLKNKQPEVVIMNIKDHLNMQTYLRKSVSGLSKGDLLTISGVTIIRTEDIQEGKFQIY